MEEVGALVFLLLGGGAVWLLKYGWSRKRETKRARSARWDAYYRSKDGATQVQVRRVYLDRSGAEHVLESSTLKTIPEQLPDWEQRFHEAMSEARSIAAARNSERTN